MGQNSTGSKEHTVYGSLNQHPRSCFFPFIAKNGTHVGIDELWFHVLNTIILSSSQVNR